LGSQGERRIGGDYSIFLRSNEGTQFDPELVAVFYQTMDDGKADTAG